MTKFLIGAATMALTMAMPASAQLLGGARGGIGGGLGGGLGSIGATSGGNLGGAVRADDLAAQARQQARFDKKVAARQRQATADAGAVAQLDGAATLGNRSFAASPAASSEASLGASAPSLRTRGVVAATRSGLRQTSATASGVAVFVPAAIAAPVAVRSYPAYSSGIYYGAGATFVDRGEVDHYIERQYGDIGRDLRGTGATVFRRGNDLVVQLPADVTFAFDKSDIRPQFYGPLNAFARTLGSYPASDVEVVGHTDSIGSDAYNVGLSERRGRSVADFLVARRTDPSRLVVEAMGKREPIDTNATVAGRAANRRVEFVIHPRVS